MSTGLKYPPERYPKISVLTPCFNRASMIERSIQSLISQSYPNLEYLMLDAGSTDGTAEILNKYRAHFAYFRSHKDSGPSQAINEGIEHATGEIIAWLNSDDYYMGDVLIQVGNAFIENPQMEMVNILGRVVRLEADGSETLLEQTTPERMQIADRMAHALFPNCRFIRKSTYARCGGNLIETAGGKPAIYTDYELVRRLALHEVKNLTLPILGYSYVAHAQSFTFSKSLYSNLKVQDEKVYHAEGLLEKYGTLMTSGARKQITRDYRKAMSLRITRNFVDGNRALGWENIKKARQIFGAPYLFKVARDYLNYRRKSRKNNSADTKLGSQ